jgi:hypothetical protein
MKNIFTLSVLLVFATASAQEKKVLFIGVDGLRSDALIQAETPHWDSLCSVGLFTYTSWHVGITVSGPSWSSMLTGVWHGKHGVTNNNYTGSNFNEYPYFITRAKEYRPDLKAVQVTSWDPMSSAVYNDGWDEKIVVPSDDACEAAGIAQLQDPEIDVLFIHIDDCDAQGHANGFSPLVDTYMNQVEYVDAQLGRILNALKARPQYANEDWMVIMTTDHGGIGTGHGGPTTEEREIWWVAAGPSVPQAEISIDLPNLGELFPDPSDYRTAPMIVDIAVTALDHLLDVDTATFINQWDLDGQSWLSYSTYIADADDKNSSFSVFPNPNNGEFAVTIESYSPNPSELNLTDLTGRVLKSFAIVPNALQAKVELNLNGMAPGTYVLRHTDGTFSTSRKVVIR